MKWTWKKGTLSYASPTYLADHLCERCKVYLETHYGDLYDSHSLSSFDSDEQLPRQIKERTAWFNDNASKHAGKLQGLNDFC